MKNVPTSSSGDGTLEGVYLVFSTMWLTFCGGYLLGRSAFLTCSSSSVLPSSVFGSVRARGITVLAVLGFFFMFMVGMVVKISVSVCWFPIDINLKFSISPCNYGEGI